MQIIAIPGQEIIVQHLGYGQSTILDKQLLRNICINLLNNDIKYSADATSIEFTTYLGKEVTITIKDLGLGIPAIDQPHLFERFFRASNVTAIKGIGWN